MVFHKTDFVTTNAIWILWKLLIPQIKYYLFLSREDLPIERKSAFVFITSSIRACAVCSIYVCTIRVSMLVLGVRSTISWIFFSQTKARRSEVNARKCSEIPKSSVSPVFSSLLRVHFACMTFEIWKLQPEKESFWKKFFLNRFSGRWVSLSLFHLCTLTPHLSLSSFLLYSVWLPISLQHIPVHSAVPDIFHEVLYESDKFLWVGFRICKPIHSPLPDSHCR